MRKLRNLLSRESFISPSLIVRINEDKSETKSTDTYSDDILNDIKIVKKFWDLFPKNDDKS